MDKDEVDRAVRRVTETVTRSLPSSVVRWAASRGAPMARMSGRTAVGSAALSHALEALTKPPHRIQLRRGTVGLEDIAARVGRDVDEIRRWQEAGLLGTPDDGADEERWDRTIFDRAALVDLALREGADEQRLIRAAAEDNLIWVALEKVLTGHAGMTGEQAAQAAGISEEFLEVLWRSLGLPTGELDAPIFERQDIYVLRTLGALQVVFSQDDLAESASVIGRAMAEVSTALTDLFRRRIAEPFYEAGGTETDVVLRLSALRSVLVPTMAPFLEVALQRHLDVAIRSEIGARMEQLFDPGAAHRVLSVGFVDLVGFTAASERLSAADVRAMASKLLHAAETAVSDHGGRIVKSIGDAVMITTTGPVQCAAAALDVCSVISADDTMPAVRAGIGHGPVLPGYADYFGRTVNLASRLCSAAKPGEVLVHVEGDPPPPDEWAAAGLQAEPRKVKHLKGIDGTVHALRVTSA